jgi:hypothetical protein
MGSVSPYLYNDSRPRLFPDWAAHRPRERAVPTVAAEDRQYSSKIVNGPSLTLWTAIMAPNRPVSTCNPRA